jgi:hypothetical protein
MSQFSSKITLLIFIILTPFAVNATDDADVFIFHSYESNGADNISSLGIGVTLKSNDSNLGFQLNTSIANAELIATDGYREKYNAWEAGVKIGYFSTLSLYIEGGVDLSEAIYNDIRYNDYEREHGYADNVDSYVGVGAGLRLGALQLDSFVRLRAIDSEYWRAESEVFSGIQISFNFGQNNHSNSK